MIAREIKQGLGVAALIIGVSVALLGAQKLNLVDGDASLRFSMALSGLILAYYGNAVPKAVFRSARSAKVQRVAGWVFVLTGLVSAAAWVFAPLEIAFAATGVVAAGLVGVIGYTVSGHARWAPHGLRIAARGMRRLNHAQ